MYDCQTFTDLWLIIDDILVLLAVHSLLQLASFNFHIGKSTLWWIVNIWNYVFFTSQFSYIQNLRVLLFHWWFNKIKVQCQMTEIFIRSWVLSSAFLFTQQGNKGETNFFRIWFFFQVEKELSQVAQACLWHIWVGRKGTGQSWGSTLCRMCPAFFCPVRGTQSSGGWTSYWPLNGQNNQLNMHQMWHVSWLFVIPYC